jgi:hypothetical protein
MPINRLYDTLHGKMKQLRPHERVTRLRNMIWLMIGILQSQSVHLSRVATRIPGAADVPSLARRLRRFLDHSAVNVREWYAPIARQWLETVGRTTGQTRLIIDGTKIGKHHQLLMVSLAWRKRAIPIAWTWVSGGKGHSGGPKQQALLAYVSSLIPAHITVCLVGDTEFETVELMRQLEHWGWQYVLRQRASTQICFQGRWQPFGTLLTQAGQSLWLEQARLTSKYAHGTNLLACWKIGADEPWLLATNLPSFQTALKAYRYRMWIEEMFGDLKDHGFDLEASRLTSFLRLSRLTLVVALLYVWMLTTASQVIKNSWRSQVDRSDRRDLSLFQIGFRFIERLISNAGLIPVAFVPALSAKLSGS